MKGDFAAPKQGGPPLDAKVRSFGKRRKSRGSHTGSTRPTAAGFECGQVKDYPSAHIPGKFKVSMPPNRVRFCVPTHPQETT